MNSIYSNIKSSFLTVIKQQGNGKKVFGNFYLGNRSVTHFTNRSSTPLIFPGIHFENKKIPPLQYFQHSSKLTSSLFPCVLNFQKRLYSESNQEHELSSLKNAKSEANKSKTWKAKFFKIMLSLGALSEILRQLLDLIDNSSENENKDIDVQIEKIIKEYKEDKKNKALIIDKITQISQEPNFASAKKLLRFMESSNEEIRIYCLYHILQILEKIKDGQSISNMTTNSLLQFEHQLYSKLKPSSDTSLIEFYLISKIYHVLTDTVLAKTSLIRGNNTQEKSSLTSKYIFAFHVLELRNRISENNPLLEYELLNANLNILSLLSNEDWLSHLSVLSIDVIYLAQIIGKIEVLSLTPFRAAIKAKQDKNLEVGKIGEGLKNEMVDGLKELSGLIKDSLNIFLRMLRTSRLLMSTPEVPEWHQELISLQKQVQTRPDEVKNFLNEMVSDRHPYKITSENQGEKTASNVPRFIGITVDCPEEAKKRLFYYEVFVLLRQIIKNNDQNSEIHGEAAKLMITMTKEQNVPWQAFFEMKEMLPSLLPFITENEQKRKLEQYCRHPGLVSAQTFYNDIEATLTKISQLPSAKENS